MKGSQGRRHKAVQIPPSSRSAHTAGAVGLSSGAISAMDALPLPTWVMDSSGAMVFHNRAWASFTGTHGPRASAPHNWLQQIHSEDRQKFKRAWQTARLKHTPLKYELRLQHGSDYHWVAVSIVPNAGQSAAQTLWYATCSDIDQHRHTQEALSHDVVQLDSMLDVSVDCIKVIRPDGTLIHMNRAGCLALGVPEDETEFGMEWLPLLPAEVQRRGQRALKQARTGKVARFAGKSRVGNRKPQYWDNILTPVVDGQGQVTSILCVSRDVTAQRVAEERLRISSEIDDLTGLLNRRAFTKRLHKTLGQARTKNQQAGLLLIDLDHFKNVNDTFGHPAGDQVLRIIAKRMKALLPKAAFLGRLGGDEFALLMENLKDQRDLIQLASQLLSQLAMPIFYSGRQIDGGLSIGGATFPAHGLSTNELMASADTALNGLKSEGRGGLRMFHQDMLETAERAAAELTRARRMIREDGVEAYFQPKVQITDGQVIGFEALLRHHGADKGLMLPDSIAEAFKNYELAFGIGQLMQTRVFETICAWRNSRLPLFPVSINAAPVEFMRGDFAINLLNRMKLYDIPPELVEIEVTEHTLFERSGDIISSTLKELKDAGIRISLDDFGTGHSSLSHLRDYPVDCIKIAPNFIAGLEHDKTLLAMVQGLLKLGSTMSIDVLAEGIQTPRQREILQQQGCKLGQGFLFGRPMRAEDAARLLTPRHASTPPPPTRVAVG